MLLRERRDVRDFAAAVDGEAHLDNPRISQLVALSRGVRALPPVQPSADFSADLRARLLTVALQELAPRGHGGAPTAAPHNRLRVGVATLASAAVLVGGGAGLTSASAAALPGDLLYPVKRGIEQVDLAVAGDLGERGRAELDRARTRLAEVDGLLRSDHSDYESGVTNTLVDFTLSATAGRTLLLQSYAATGRDGELAALQEFAVDSGDSLNGMASSLPATAHSAFADAADVVVRIDSEVEQICSTCASGGGNVTVPVPGDTAGPSQDGSTNGDNDTVAVVDSPGEASGPSTATTDPEEPAPQPAADSTASGPTEDPSAAPAPASASASASGPTDTGTEPPAETAPGATATPAATDAPKPAPPAATAPSQTAPSQTTPSQTTPSQTTPSDDSSTADSTTADSTTTDSTAPPASSADSTTTDSTAPPASSAGDGESVPSDAASSDPAPSDVVAGEPDSSAPSPDGSAATAPGDELDSAPTDAERRPDRIEAPTEP